MKTFTKRLKFYVYETIKLILQCRNSRVAVSFREIQCKKSIGELLCKMLCLDSKKVVKKTKWEMLRML